MTRLEKTSSRICATDEKRFGRKNRVAHTLDGRLDRVAAPFNRAELHALCECTGLRRRPANAKSPLNTFEARIRSIAVAALVSDHGINFIENPSMKFPH
jgi:hypothetical protein